MFMLFNMFRVVISTILKKLLLTSSYSLTMHTVHISDMPRHYSVSKSSQSVLFPVYSCSYVMSLFAVRLSLKIKTEK